MRLIFAWAHMHGPRMHWGRYVGRGIRVVASRMQADRLSWHESRISAKTLHDQACAFGFFECPLPKKAWLWSVPHCCRVPLHALPSAARRVFTLGLRLAATVQAPPPAALGDGNSTTGTAPLASAAPGAMLLSTGLARCMDGMAAMCMKRLAEAGESPAEDQQSLASLQTTMAGVLEHSALLLAASCQAGLAEYGRLIIGDTHRSSVGMQGDGAGADSGAQDVPAGVGGMGVVMTEQQSEAAAAALHASLSTRLGVLLAIAAHCAPPTSQRAPSPSLDTARGSLASVGGLAAISTAQAATLAVLQSAMQTCHYDNRNGISVAKVGNKYSTVLLVVEVVRSYLQDLHTSSAPATTSAATPATGGTSADSSAAGAVQSHTAWVRVLLTAVVPLAAAAAQGMLLAAGMAAARVCSVPDKLASPDSDGASSRQQHAGETSTPQEAYVSGVWRLLVLGANVVAASSAGEGAAAASSAEGLVKVSLLLHTACDLPQRCMLLGHAMRSCLCTHLGTCRLPSNA